MTLEQLEIANELANTLQMTRQRVAELRTLKTYFDIAKDATQFCHVEAAGNRATVEVGHFSKFLDVELMRAEADEERQAKELEAF